MIVPYHRTIIAVCFVGFVVCMAFLFAGCTPPTAPTPKRAYLNWYKIAATCSPKQPVPIIVGASDLRCGVMWADITAGTLVCVDESIADAIVSKQLAFDGTHLLGVFTPQGELCGWGAWPL